MPARYAAVSPSARAFSMRRHLPSLAVFMLLCGADPLRAQDAIQLSELRPGLKIRVEAPGVIFGTLTAMILSRSPDSIAIANSNFAPISIPLSKITRLDVSRGKSHKAGAVRGLKWGVPLGLAIGAIAAAGAFDCTCYVCKNCEELKTPPAQGFGLGLLSGVAYGAGIGALVPRESWARLELTPRTSLDAGAIRGGLALRASF